MAALGIAVSALLFSACDAKDETETVSASPVEQQLREQAGLHPGDERPSQQLREHLDIQTDEQPPPNNEAEMRERMKLHPERVEEE